MTSTLPRLPVFEAIAGHDQKSTAVVHSASGRRFTYGELLGDVAEAKDRLVREAGGRAIDGHRIAFLVENSYDYVGAQQASLLKGLWADRISSNSPRHPGRAFHSSTPLPRFPRP
jgi:hypothetical protein